MGSFRGMGLRPGALSRTDAHRGQTRNLAKLPSASLRHAAYLMAFAITAVIHRQILAGSHFSRRRGLPTHLHVPTEDLSFDNKPA